MDNLLFIMTLNYYSILCNVYQQHDFFYVRNKQKKKKKDNTQQEREKNKGRRNRKKSKRIQAKAKDTIEALESLWQFNG